MDNRTQSGQEHFQRRSHCLVIVDDYDFQLVQPWKQNRSSTQFP